MAIDLTTYDDNNIFAKILRGELPAKVLHDSEHVLAFPDIAPQAPVHILVIPKGRYIAQGDFHATASDAEITELWRAVAALAAEHCAGGHRVIANQGSDSGQLIPHFHVHILGGRRLGALVPEA